MVDAANLHNVYLGLGANLGDKLGNIRGAIGAIGEQIGEVAKVSSMYETKPQGFDSDNEFINAACHVKSKLTPDEILEAIRTIECALGRKSKSVNGFYADRPIDIDILMYDNVVVEENNLVIPHPLMHNRNYVLEPLSEIAPDAVHPLLHKTIRELNKELKR